jgi:hypothetical protein
MDMQDRVTDKLRNLIAPVMHAETLDLRVEYVIALRQLSKEIDDELYRQFTEFVRQTPEFRSHN